MCLVVEQVCQAGSGGQSGVHSPPWRSSLFVDPRAGSWVPGWGWVTCGSVGDCVGHDKRSRLPCRVWGCLFPTFGKLSPPSRGRGALVQGNSFGDVNDLINLYWKQELELNPVIDPPES